MPIISVPSQVLINMYNVKEFLEDEFYVPSYVKFKEVKGVNPECVMVCRRSLVGIWAVKAYEVRDWPSGLKAEDWD